MEEKDLESLQHEVKVMRQLEHTNIVQLYDVEDTKSKMYLVMDLCGGGELFDRIVSKGSYTEKEAAGVVKQVASALVYIHSQNIVHRDLKPENLLYASDRPDAPIKIIDFGLAKEVPGGSPSLSTPCGTPGYVAPEILKDQKYGKPVDMWSLGVILYILLCGFPPFYDNGNNLRNLYSQIRRGKYSFPSPYWDKISKQAKDLIGRLLVVKPAKRYTGPQCLEHPWIKGMAPDTQIAVTKLKAFQYRKRLRKGVNTVRAVLKLISILEEKEPEEVIKQFRKRREILRNESVP